MGLRVAIQMDPLERINPAGDSTILLAWEACRRGYELWHYTPDALTFSLQHGLTAKARRWSVDSLESPWRYTLAEAEPVNLADMDMILLRQDPPYDMAYLTTTYLLEGLARRSGKTPLIVNDPAQVRNHPEKWFPLQFPDLVPPTLITRDLDALKAFRAEQGEIVLKPLYGYGGKSVFHINKTDSNFYSFLEMYFEMTREPIVAQRFLPDVREREMRVVVIGDVIAPALNRVPPEGEIRSNLRIGGEGRPAALTPRQQAMVERLVPELRSRGLYLTGLDLIGEYVTEINITSPTGLRSINRLCGQQLERIFWDGLEARLAAA
jgi:glutathione synthase